MITSIKDMLAGTYVCVEIQEPRMKVKVRGHPKGTRIGQECSTTMEPSGFEIALGLVAQSEAVEVPVQSTSKKRMIQELDISSSKLSPILAPSLPFSITDHTQIQQATAKPSRTQKNARETPKAPLPMCAPLPVEGGKGTYLYRRQIHKLIRPYVQGTHDPPADGHCGFHSLARALRHLGKQ